MNGKKLANLRKQQKISQEKLANMLNVSRSTVAMWENNSNEPDNKTLVKIANILNTTTDDLLENKNVKKGIKVPVLGEVAAGIPISAIEDIVDYEEITEELAASGEYFGLIIKGDSMEPRMTSGDVVIVRSQDYAETGDIAIVLVDGEVATCKKIKKTPQGLMLISLNPAYEPILLKNFEEIVCCGRVVGKLKRK